MRCKFPPFLAALAVFLTTGVCVRAQYQPYPQQQYPQQQQGQYPQQPYPQGQQYPPQNAGQDSPNAGQQQSEDLQRGVARISVVQGDVNVKRGDTGEIVSAGVNAPLAAQDRLQTGQGSRAEVELDYGNLVRLAPGTDLGMSGLQYHRYQLQLAAGTIDYRVLRTADSQSEIDTPSIAIKPARLGEYRISVFDDGTTQITVRSGELEIYSPRGSRRISGGKTVLVRGNPSDPEFQTTYEVARDQFDNWCEGRDRQLLASQSYRYVSPDIDGADDLDQYGTWVPSQYGTVWAPRAPVPGWAPYSYGHWVWEGYYGWSWVDYAPWGWAPYHYGRWFWNGGHGWCWWGGPAYGRHLWSPALVGFFGVGGVGVGFGIGGFGGLGWVALAPFELFHPWWGRGFHGGYYGRGGYGNVTIVRNTNITNIYRNTRINGGAITSRRNGFGGVNQGFGRANFSELRSASLVRGGIPAAPTRANLQYGNRQAFANPRFATAERRSFFQQQRAPQLARSGVAQQQTHVQQDSRVAASGGNRSGSVTAPQNRAETRGAYVSRFGSGGGVQPGWQRFGSPGPANGFMQGAVAGGAGERSGWHQFGAPPQHTQTMSGRAYSSGGGAGGYRGQSNANAAYRAPAYHYSAPVQASRGGGGYSRSGGESSSHSGGGGSYHGGSSHGGGGGGHRGK